MIAHRTAARVQEALRGRLFDKIVALGPAWFGAERTGGVMLSLVDGVEQLQSFFGQYLPQVTIALCAPVAIFAFIAWWDVPVALVMLAAALFTLVLPVTVHRRTAAASRERQAPSRRSARNSSTRCRACRHCRRSARAPPMGGCWRRRRGRCRTAPSGCWR